MPSGVTGMSVSRGVEALAEPTTLLTLATTGTERTNVGRFRRAVCEPWLSTDKHNLRDFKIQRQQSEKIVTLVGGLLWIRAALGICETEDCPYPAAGSH